MVNYTIGTSFAIDATWLMAFSFCRINSGFQMFFSRHCSSIVKTSFNLVIPMIFIHVKLCDKLDYSVMWSIKRCWIVRQLCRVSHAGIYEPHSKKYQAAISVDWISSWLTENNMMRAYTHIDKWKGFLKFSRVLFIFFSFSPFWNLEKLLGWRTNWIK